MNKTLVIGGSNGIGLAVAAVLLHQGNTVCIIDKDSPDKPLPPSDRLSFQQVNLLDTDFGFLDNFQDYDSLVFTAGFGRVARFETMQEAEIDNGFCVNTVSALKVIRHFYPRMLSDKPFYCAVMGSIAGLVSSPLFALYGAAKAALCRAIESINIELEMSGSDNRILNVSPGSISGTRFNGGENDLSQTAVLAEEIVRRMLSRETLFIPQYDEIYKDVIARYHADAHQYGIDSFNYKMSHGRLNDRPQLKVGYLSGTFDLFHIGHLNLLRNARQYCDYLVVGVHRDASHKGKETLLSFEDRMTIVGGCRYVNQVIPSEPEDCDVYLKGIVKYDYLFVGSDYKDTDRFKRYEQIFSDKGVRIVYFPYTQGISSTQLREAIRTSKSYKSYEERQNN
ncbi:MAG: SDR family NAD(P)-dependent oxidoreductase [Bacteroidales bacterium]|nr:SDR family NAD(P)-dependent oxidoreductase [Bacteroidales bacterium]